MHAKEIQYVEELQAKFKNNIDRINADWEKKLTQQMIAMDEKMRCTKLKKWCPVCLQEVTIETGFNPSKKNYCRKKCDFLKCKFTIY